MSTRPRFEKVSKDTSEMAYWSVAKQHESLAKRQTVVPYCLIETKNATVIEQHRAWEDEP